MPPLPLGQRPSTRKQRPADYFIAPYPFHQHKIACLATLFSSGPPTLPNSLFQDSRHLTLTIYRSRTHYLLAHASPCMHTSHIPPPLPPPPRSIRDRGAFAAMTVSTWPGPSLARHAPLCREATSPASSSVNLPLAFPPPPVGQCVAPCTSDTFPSRRLVRSHKSAAPPSA